MNKSSITKHVKTLFLSLFMVMAMGQFAYAQQTITGTVTDAETGSTLVGATVQIQGTTRGTITDVDGNFSLSASEGETLVFSYIGYEKQMVALTGQSTVNVALQPTAKSLGEVVVIGYGVQKKDDNTGSVTAISSKDFNKGAITSPQELLTGKVAGVQITSGGGAPGEGQTIRIRGGSSLRATNDPLIVVDGVPLSGGGINGMRNPLNSINPNDIESFTVLKDASATAIYGSRASNGVIIITTKKSKEGAGLEVNYSGKLNAYVAGKTVDVLKSDEFRELVAEKYPDEVSMLGDASTDWQNKIYENATGMDHNLSISGAFRILPYRLSVGYSDNDGILKTDNIKRTTVGLNLNPTLFDDHLKINVNAKGVNLENTFANRDAIGAAIQFDPTKPVYSDETYTGIPILGTTDWGGYYTWTQANGQPKEFADNPVALLNQRDDNSTVNRFIGNAKFDYKFHFLPELRANLNVAYDYTKAEGNVFVPQNAAFAYNNVHGGGVDNSYEQEKKNELFDFYLNYVKEIESIDSKIDAMAGYSWQHFWEISSSVNSNVANTPLETTNPVDSTELYLVSFFGRLNYTLKEKYLLTFTLRNDGTSRFSPDTRWGLFPSAALGWKINEESFLEDVDAVSQLKLRLGWGITGQQDVGGNYVYMPRYTYNIAGAYYMFGGVPYQTVRPEGYDDDIKWEETVTYNIALDYGFLNDRINGSIDFYLRETNDLLNEIPPPAGSNLTNFIVTNVGDLENKGVEFTINGKPISKEDMVWDIGLNVTYNENKITKLTPSDEPGYLGIETGGISGGVGSTIQMHSVGQPANSFFVYEQVYDENGKPIPGVFVDQNNDGTINDNDRIHKENPAPDMSFGISSSLSYKNWYFSFAGRANIGNYVYHNVDSENGVYQRLYRPEGPYLGNVTTTVFDSDFQKPYYLSDHYLKDGSFFRMDNITLSYLFEDLVQQGVNLTVSATVNNAFVITKYNGIDPELVNGIDNRLYPRPTTYSLGVNLNF